MRIPKTWRFARRILIAGALLSATFAASPQPSKGAAIPADTWTFHHLGFVVKDITQAANVYQQMDFAQTQPPKDTVWNDTQHEVFGKPLSASAPVTFKERAVKRGKITLRFIQPRSGEDLNTQYLRAHGEGVSYICFTVADLASEHARLVAQGFPVIQRVKRADGSLLETYHDTRKVGNVAIALRQASPDDARATAIDPKDPWRFETYDHIAFVVKDMDQASRHFQAMGMQVVSEDTSTWGGDFMKYQGKPLPMTPLRLNILLKGGVAIELFAVKEGENLWSHHLKKYGEGVHHIHYSVVDLDRETAKLVQKGFPTTFTITMPGRLVEAFFEPYGSMSVALYRVKGIPARFKGLPES